MVETTNQSGAEGPRVDPSIYDRLAAATPAERAEIVLRLIEEHPHGRLELPTRNGMNATLDEIDLSPKALESRAGQREDAPWWDRDGRCLCLKGADLRGASLRKANLRQANMVHADLLGAALGTRQSPEYKTGRLQSSRGGSGGADLSGASLGEADLRESMLEEANLQGAVLRFAKLERAALEHSILSSADLWGVNLESAVLKNADLRGAVLEEANLQCADLAGANVRDAVFGRASLRQRCCATPSFKVST